MNAALSTASAFKISFATSCGARAAEDMLSMNSLTSTSNGFMKCGKQLSVSEDLSRHV